MAAHLEKVRKGPRRMVTIGMSTVVAPALVIGLAFFTPNSAMADEATDGSTPAAAPAAAPTSAPASNDTSAAPAAPTDSSSSPAAPDPAPSPDPQPAPAADTSASPAASAPSDTQSAPVAPAPAPAPAPAAPAAAPVQAQQTLHTLPAHVDAPPQTQTATKVSEFLINRPSPARSCVAGEGVTIGTAQNVTLTLTIDGKNVSEAELANVRGPATYFLLGTSVDGAQYASGGTTKSYEGTLDGPLTTDDPACQVILPLLTPEEQCGQIETPADTDRVTFSREGDVITATLVDSVHYKFAYVPNGWIINEGGTTATFTIPDNSSSCGPQQRVVTVSNPMVLDSCGVHDVKLPSDTTDVTYTRVGDTVIATLVDAKHTKFGTLPAGWVVSRDGKTATFCLTFTSKPCVVVVQLTTPVKHDLCGTANDSYDKFADTENVKFTYDGNTITATLIPSDKPGTTVKFGDLPEGWTLSEDGQSATYTVIFTDEPCVVVIPPNPPVPPVNPPAAPPTQPAGFTPSVPSTVSSTDTSNRLASTGSDEQTPALWALLIIGAGIGALVFRRRKAATSK